jgi:hypothetical protein
MKPRTLTLAMTGASGADYTLRLFEYCLQQGIHVQFITSQPGQIVLGMETELKLSGPPQKMQQQFAGHFGADPALISVYSKDQWTAPPASGSSVADAMVVCPCSMGTLASIAIGSSDQGAQDAGPGAAGDALFEHTSRKHAQTVAPRRGHPAAESGFLPRRRAGIRPRGLRGRADTRSTRYRQRSGAALGSIIRC